MSFNRSIAKTRAVQRGQEGKALAHGFRIPNFAAWEPAPPLPSLRCRHCGSTITSRASRCSTCWRPL